MAVHLVVGTALTLTEAAKSLLPLRGGKRVHLATLHRWVQNGVRGVRLESVRLGRTVLTSRAALQRFAERLSARGGPASAASPEAAKRATGSTRNWTAMSSRTVEPAGEAQLPGAAPVHASLVRTSTANSTSSSGGRSGGRAAMKYACWRCMHAIERTATECPGCGKALAPVPWLRKPWLSPRAFNNAVVSDYMRRVHPVLSVLVVLFFFGILLIGVWTTTGFAKAMEREITLQAAVRATMAEREVPPDFQDLLEGLMESKVAGLSEMAAGGRMYIVIGFLGACWTAFPSFMVRRLLPALPSAAAESGLPNEYRILRRSEAEDRT